MIQETLLRLSQIEGISAPVIVCNQEHRFTIAEQLQQIDVVRACLILEPEAKNTAPAALLASLYVQQYYGRDALLLILPADHLIRDIDAFHRAVRVAVMSAKEGHLVTFGVTPTHPETGYGYIECGATIGRDVYQVARFIEKPSLSSAEHYLAEKKYLWNSGMFVFSVQAYQDEISSHAPGIMLSCQQAFEKAVCDLDFIRVDADAFSDCPSDSIDYAVMEKTEKAVVVPLNAGWSDLGSWSSLWDVLPKNSDNNVLVGDVLTHDVNSCYIRAEHKLVAAVGMSDCIIVETDDAILVADKKNTQDVKEIVKRLQADNRLEHHAHSVVYRPWGNYQCLDQGKNFQVKRICVKPRAKLSLQLHHHRAEHWIVVKGTAKVRRGDDEFLLSENQSTYISVGEKHRLENVGASVLEVIEVQSGDYLGEDDIVRFDDDYQRL